MFEYLIQVPIADPEPSSRLDSVGAVIRSITPLALSAPIPRDPSPVASHVSVISISSSANDNASDCDMSSYRRMSPTQTHSHAHVRITPCNTI